MRLYIKYSVLPGIVIAVASTLEVIIMTLVNSYVLKGAFSDTKYDLPALIFFYFVYYGKNIASILFSSILSKKQPLIVSMVLALISVLVLDFTLLLFLGIYNQLSVGIGMRISLSPLIMPLFTRGNYVLLDKPFLIILLTIAIVAITRFFIYIKNKAF